ncbi:C6 zinc finger domain-containing protein [Plectosphaerella plurivora]|uniref:C6 zinc finger domain-containing protein n=1 Tax=Plectosphaerella plurivora TaxID=936078 RepID=A0A9P8V191_9PEZI|nr:C6 zinc finger domain-containing protein [Plectosphaerella plurivora]
MEPPGPSSASVPEDVEQPTASQSTRNPRPPPRGTASYQRRRAVKACQVCRARRTKCDNLKPSCSFCLKVGATCIQSPVDLSSFDPASLKILERLDDLERLLEAATLGSSEEPVHKTRVVQAAAGESPQATRRDAHPIEMGMVLPLGLDNVLSWPCFSGGRPAHELHLQPPPSLLGVSPSRSTHHLGASASPASFIGAVDLEPVRVKDLLNNFFSYVHVKNPIFDEAATRRVVQSTVLNGIDWSGESCLSLIICALGSIATPFGPSYETMPGTSAYSSAMSFFHAAQKRIGTLLYLDDILAPQCLFLSGVFMMCIFQQTKAWRYFVQALAHCQQLGFLSQEHAADADQQGATPRGHDSDSLHQAIYWSAWKSERELRSSMRMADFSPNDHGVNLYPSFFPTPPAPRSGETSEMNPDQQREQTSWYFYLAEISLRRLAARIGDEIETMQKTHPTRLAFLHAAASATPAYEAEIDGWVGSLPPSLSFDAPLEEDDVCRFVLRGHCINLFEMIYWPFLAAHTDNLAPEASVLAPFTALAQKSLDNHAMRLAVNEPGYKHRHHGTMPLIHSCSRSALVLLAVALHNSVERGGHGTGCSLIMPPGWTAAVSAVTQLHDYWNGEIQELGEARHMLEWGLFAAMG